MACNSPVICKTENLFYDEISFLKRESCFNLWYGSKYFMCFPNMAGDGDLLSHTAMVYTGGMLYMYY